MPVHAFLKGGQAVLMVQKHEKSPFLADVRQPPEGRCDRSLARSAWKRPPKEPSRRVRYDRAHLITEVFLVESASRRTTLIRVRHETPNDVRADGPFPKHQHFFGSLIRNLVTPILQSPNRSAAHRQESDRTLRDGSIGGGDVPRHFVPGYDRTVPPGTKAIRPSGGLASSQRLWG